MAEAQSAGLIEQLVGAIGKLADIFTNNQAWGVVAALFVLLVMQAFVNRRDRIRRDDKLGDLLETRNDQLMATFERALVMVQSIKDLGDRVEDMEDRINAMDARCDARQRNRASERRLLRGVKP